MRSNLDSYRERESMERALYSFGYAKGVNVKSNLHILLLNTVRNYKYHFIQITVPGRTIQNYHNS